MTTRARIPDRSAHAAITGFDYQFDHTVLALLNAATTTEIDIEGIEDVDVHELTVDTAIQVKYFAAGRYKSPKTLRAPVALMLDHFKTGAKWQYVLHAHFGDFNGMPKSLTLDQMKDCLTKTVRDSGQVIELFEGLSDAQLQDFCGRLSIRSGESFSEQEGKVITALTARLRCSNEEVEAIYLAKAREFVHNRARSSNPTVRRVKSQDLNDFLQVRELLYRRWNLESVGRDKYLRAQISLLKRTGFADKNVRRALLLTVTNTNLDAVAELCQSLANLHIRSGRLKSAKPWLVAIQANDDNLLGLKSRLVRENVAFNDGYEAIEFSVKALDTPPIVNVVEGSDRLKSSSYLLRLVSEPHLREYAEGGYTVPRFIVCQDVEAWHANFSTNTFSLREFETKHLSELMEAIA